MGSQVTKLGGTMSKWVSGPIAAVGAGIFALVSKTAEAGDEVQKMALRTGFSTEALSEYKHAAELSGTSLDSLERGVKRMQRTLLDAEKGSKSATDSLDALGLSIKDLQGLSPEEQFDKLAMSIASVEDPTRRAALAQEVFGRAGTELLPMLDAGAEGIAEMRQEARDLGIVFDQEAADAAAQFNDDIDRLKKGFAGMFQEIGRKLLPLIIEDFLPMIKENVIPAVQSFGEWIERVINWFTELDPKWQQVILAAAGLLGVLGPLLLILGPIITAIGSIIGLLPVLGTAFTAMTGPIGLVVAAIAAAIAIGTALYQNWDSIVAELQDLWTGFSGFFADIWDGIKQAAKGAINSVIGFINRLIRAWNDFSFEIPPVVVAGRTVFEGFRINTPNIPEIPLLAKGGIVTRPTLAVIGEAGPEAVIPLNRGAAAAAGIGPITVNIYGSVGVED